jgi:hypothetical protein
MQKTKSIDSELAESICMVSLLPCIGARVGFAWAVYSFMLAI